LFLIWQGKRFTGGAYTETLASHRAVVGLSRGPWPWLAHSDRQPQTSDPVRATPVREKRYGGVDRVVACHEPLASDGVTPAGVAFRHHQQRGSPPSHRLSEECQP
jgi:hypothetical protein